MEASTATRPTTTRDNDEPDGQDAEKGRLFEVPRVAIVVDDTDPTVLKLAFSGSIELDRTNASDVELYNRIVSGKNVALEVEAHVADDTPNDGEGTYVAVPARSWKPVTVKTETRTILKLT